MTGHQYRRRTVPGPGSVERRPGSTPTRGPLTRPALPAGTFRSVMGTGPCERGQPSESTELARCQACSTRIALLNGMSRCRRGRSRHPPGRHGPRYRPSEWTHECGHAGLGPRRGLLPGLPRPVRRERRASPSRARSSRGTRRRRPTASRAATCSASSSTSTTSRTWASPRSTSPRSSRRPRTTAITRTTTSRSTRCSAATTRCASCSTRRTTAACGSSSTASSTTPGRGFWPFHHILENGAASPYRDWFHLDERAPRRRPAAASPTRRPARRRRRAARLRGVVGPAGAAQAQHRRPGGPRVPVRRRRALAPLRDRRLAARRPRGDRRRVVLAGVPAPLPGDPARRLPRRRDLARRARMGPRRPLRCADELPARRGDPRVRRRVAPRHGGRPGHDRVRRPRPAARRAGVRGPGRGARSRPTTPTSPAVQLNLLGSHDTPRLRTRAGRRPSPAVRLAIAPPGDAARRAVPLLRRRDRAGRRQRPGQPRRVPVGRGALGRRGCATSSGRCSTCGRSEPALRDGPLRVGRRGGIGGRLRARRRGGAVRRRGQRRRRAGPTRASVRRRAGRRRRASRARSSCPAFDRPAETRIVDGDATVDLERRPRRRCCGSSCVAASARRAAVFGHTPRSVADLPIDLGRRARRAAGPGPRRRGEDPAGARGTRSGRRT